MPLVDLSLNFIKIKSGMTSLWRHQSFLLTLVHILYSIEHTNLILGTNTQQYDIHIMVKVKVTLTDDEGHKWRSKVTKNELMVISRKFYTYRQYTRYLCTIQLAISNDISSWSWDKVKVTRQGQIHRRGGVCVLWMLFFFFLSFFFF